MGGDHFYDENQTSAWRAMCIMLRGSMKSHNGDFIVSLRIFHCAFHINAWRFQYIFHSYLQDISFLNPGYFIVLFI